jgi:hypothetical protein
MSQPRDPFFFRIEDNFGLMASFFFFENINIIINLTDRFFIEYSAFFY